MNQRSKDLIKKFEGLRLTAYKCSAGVDTIGWGNTFYEDGSKVKPGDRITRERADKLFEILVARFAEGVRSLVKAELNENQFGALVSFAYNAGTAALGRSTLLRRVNANPNDPAIRAEFMKWTKAGGKVLRGLQTRRNEEADLYFLPE